MNIYRICAALLTAILITSLTACGGGGSNGDRPSGGLTVSGTASQGVPITGTVTLKDSRGATRTGNIDPATGAYSIVVDGMTAPFVLKAGNFYAASGSATTININPLTNLCLQKAAGSATPEQVFADVTNLASIATKITALVDDLNMHLDRLYPSTVPATRRDFMHGTVLIDQGVDLVLSKITIASDAAGFTIRYDSLPIITGSAGGNGTVVVTSNGTYLGYAANNLFSSPPAYSVLDLEGTWYLFQYVGGTDNPYWARATLTVNRQGTGTLSNSVNAHGGHSSLTNLQLSVGSTGVISVSGSGTKMNLSSDKSLAIGTGGTNGDESLYVLVKAGSGFKQGDLVGDWKIHSLVASATFRDWQRGDCTFSSSGVGTTTNIVKGSGYSVTGNPATLSVAANGVVTAPSGFPLDFFGALTRDRNLLVATWSNSDGTHAIGFFVRKGLQNATMVDMVGTWKMNFLALYPTQAQWARYLATLSWIGSTSSQMVINEVAMPDEISLFTSQNIISADGVFTSNMPTEGILSLDKKLLIYTSTGSNDSRKLGISIR